MTAPERDCPECDEPMEYGIPEMFRAGRVFYCEQCGITIEP